MKTNVVLQKIRQRWSLRSRIVLGLIALQLLLMLGVLANDFVVNERAEALVWNTSLQREMDYLIQRRTTNPDYEWPDTDMLAMFAIDPANKNHEPLANLGPGLHDEFIFNGICWVILIREVGGQQLALLLNIDDLENEEAKLRNTLLLVAAIVSVSLIFFIAWAAGWLVRPLQELARQIQTLTPDEPGKRVLLPDNSSAELEIIAEAMNTYIKRNELFIEREHDFINMASHELRTPLAVIGGVVKLLLDENNIPDKTNRRLHRIQDAISNVNEMIALLLVLAKDPARVHENSELIFLDQVLQEIVKEHEFIANDKEVAIVMKEIHKVEIVAPLQMVKCALGNLLRNAIEHSHGGEIFICLQQDSTVTIENLSNHMSMQEISELYGRLARNNGRNGGGLGLDLIRRLCVHCKWQLSFSSESDVITAAVRFY